MTQRTTAARYARALFDVALAEDSPEVVEQQLAATVELFTGHDDLWRAVTNPAIPVQKKKAAVDELLPKLSIQPVLAKLISMMAGRDRLQLLPDLLDTYRVRLMDHQQVVRVQVTSAVPLDTARASALQEKLGHLTGRTVLMQTSIDTALIGGVVARIGSTVYDGSVKRQLEKMKERLAGAV